MRRLLSVRVVDHVKILVFFIFFFILPILFFVLIWMFKLKNKLVVQQRPEPTGMERSVTAVNAAANRVLFSLRLGSNNITTIDLGPLAYVQH